MLFDHDDCLALFRQARGHYVFVARLCYQKREIPLDKLTVGVHDIVTVSSSTRRSPPSPEPPVMDAMTPDARATR
jgi:hypothetical protein